MRDEWTNGIASHTTPPMVRNGYSTSVSNAAAKTADSRSSQGLTHVGRETGLDRSASLNLAARAMKLKMKTKGLDIRQREVSERRQVGDAESMVNPPTQSTGDGTPWWRNVGMDEGL